MQQPVEVVTIEDDVATITLKATELKHSRMDWSVEEIHKEFTVFKILAKYG